MVDVKQNVRKLITDFTCGFCDSRSGYEVEFANSSVWRGSWGDLYAGRAFAVVKCRNCELLNAFIFRVTEEDFELPFGGEHIGPYLSDHPEIISPGYDEEQDTISPTFIEFIGQYPYGYKLPDSVPELIRKDLREAGNVLAVGASNAAVIMCRRVVERLAAHFGVTPDKNRMLGSTLNELEKRNLVHAGLLKALREIKDWGNLGTHPSKDEREIDINEARKIVDLVFQIVENTFPKIDIEKTAEELRNLREKKPIIDNA